MRLIPTRYWFMSHFRLKGTGITFKELFYLPPCKEWIVYTNGFSNYFPADCELHSKHISRKIFINRWMVTLGLKRTWGKREYLVWRWRYNKFPHWHFTLCHRRFWFGRIVIYSPSLSFPQFRRWYPKIKGNLTAPCPWFNISWLGILLFQWSK